MSQVNLACDFNRDYMAEYVTDNRSLVGFLARAECAFVSFVALLDVDRQVKNPERVIIDAGLVTPDGVDAARKHARDVFIRIFTVEAPKNYEFIVNAQGHPKFTRRNISVFTVAD